MKKFLIGLTVVTLASCGSSSNDSIGIDPTLKPPSITVTKKPGGFCTAKELGKSFVKEVSLTPARSLSLISRREMTSNA